MGKNKIVQVAVAGSNGGLYALCSDGSLWLGGWFSDGENSEYLWTKIDTSGIPGIKGNEGNALPKTPRTVFIKPTVAQVDAYCKERKNGITGQEFVDHYTAIGWVVGKNKTPMKDWQGTVRTWENFRNGDNGQAHGEEEQPNTPWERLTWNHNNPLQCFRDRIYRLYKIAFGTDWDYPKENFHDSHSTTKYAQIYESMYEMSGCQDVKKGSELAKTISLYAIGKIIELHAELNGEGSY
jgi:hypothetical protein